MMNIDIDKLAEELWICFMYWKSDEELLRNKQRAKEILEKYLKQPEKICKCIVPSRIWEGTLCLTCWGRIKDVAKQT